MRRKYFGFAIAAIATLGPMQAFGGDREIAEQIIQRLKHNRDTGALEDFSLDLKVDQGVVLFRGNVSQQAQKDLVLQAARDIEGIANIVDEVSVRGTLAPANTTVLKPQAAVAKVSEGIKDLVAMPIREAAKPVAEENFSLREALAQRASAIMSQRQVQVGEPIQELVVESMQEVVPGEVQMASAVELAVPTGTDADQQLVTDVVSALGRAKSAGQLKGFGVDVKSNDGVVQLHGRASSAAQRDAILDIARRVAGVTEIHESIMIPSQSPSLPQLPEPKALQNPVVQAQPASVRTPAAVPAQTAPYHAPQGYQGYPGHQGQVPAQTASYGHATAGAPVMGQPVPMAPYSGVAGAPRYDSPQLPNYAWPGYASHPNYAALTYPQQYSPSAWPYIGPFYPYPQVPLGWRKVSLEWDDGWWFLDFTDR